MADKFGLRAWTINLRTWIFGFTCLVFKTTYIDAEKPLWEGAFFFMRRTLSPPLDKRNTRDKAEGKAYHFGRGISGSWAVRCLSTLNRGQDSPTTGSYRSRSEAVLVSSTTYIAQPSDPYRLSFPPIWGATIAPQWGI